MKSRVRYSIFLIFLGIIVLINLNFALGQEIQVLNRTAKSINYINTTSNVTFIEAYPIDINMKNLSGEYRPYTEVTSFYANRDDIYLAWNNKSVIFKFYTKNESGYKEFFENKSQADLEKINLSTTIMPGKGLYYYVHNMTINISNQPTIFGYEIISESSNCWVEGFNVNCDNQSINFEQAVLEQNLTVNLTNSSVEFSGADLSFIDPVVRVFANDADGGHTHTLCYEFLDQVYDFGEDVLRDIGTDSDPDDGEVCNAWMEFDLDAIDDPGDIGQITDVDLFFEVTNVVDDDCGSSGASTDFGLFDNAENYDLSDPNDPEMEALFDRLEDMSSSPWELFTISPEEGEEGDYFRDITTTSVINEIMDNLDGNPDDSLIIGIEGDDEGENQDCQIDMAGSQSVNPPYVTITYISSDVTPPSTTATATSPPGEDGYIFGEITHSNVEITLSCNDLENSCDTTRYCTDTSNTCTPSTTYTSPFIISTEGTSYVRYRSNDTIGNLESTKSKTLIIEKQNFTSNVFFYVGGIHVWNETDTFHTTETINFTSQLNTALDSCVADSEDYCTIPLTLHSDTAGGINLSDININFNITNYIWNVSNFPEQQTYKIRALATDGILNSSWDESDFDFTIGELELEIVNLSVIYQNNKERIFRFVVTNTHNESISNISWILNTGETNLSSQYNVTLSPAEEYFVYAFYNYTNSGGYTVTATAQNEQYSARRSMNIQV